MKRDTEDNKRRLIIAMEKSLGIVTAACKEANLSRDCFYNYYREDADFKAAIDSINDITLDFAENQLLKKIKEGSERSIIFYMKHKGKKRGYVSSTDITTNGAAIATVINIIDPTKRNDDRLPTND